MKGLGQAVSTIYRLDDLSDRNIWINKIHPLVKLIITILYIMTVVSFSKYDLVGLLGMTVYPIVLFVLGDMSLSDCFKRFRLVLPLICVVGIVNPFFDQSIIGEIGGIAVSGGVLSMITIIIKGLFTIIAVYLLIATTNIEQIAYALRIIHIPGIIVTVILLIYRYITVLIVEADNLNTSYSLRAPKQTGINCRVWGPFIGQLLLRSIDRAQIIYESMQLRGYSNALPVNMDIKFTGRCFAYLILWSIYLLLFKLVPVFEIIGQIF